MDNDHNSYERKFSELMAGLGDDKAPFLENPVEFLLRSGIPLAVELDENGNVSETLDPHHLPKRFELGKTRRALDAEKLPEAEHLSVASHWWGFDIVMNERLTSDIVTGAIAVGPLGGILAGAFVGAGVMGGPVAAAIGVCFATAIGLKVAEIKIVDNGRGVYWRITWPQLFLVTSAVLPPLMLVAAMTFIHPLRN